MTIDDRPTLPEQYTRAMSSSHLQVVELRRGDIDIIVAAGFIGNVPDPGTGDKDWKRHRLGALLFRLAMEYDAARGEHSLVVGQISALTDDAQRLERQAKRLKKAGKRGEAAELGEKANAMRKEITRALMSERLFHMGRLKSMVETKEALSEWAMERAIATRFKCPGQMPSDIHKVPTWRQAARARATSVVGVAGRVLDIFLDNLCAHCQARGYNGGFGTPSRICSACHGSGKRETSIGGEPVEENFGRLLLLEIDELMTRAEREMRRALASTAD